VVTMSSSESRGDGVPMVEESFLFHHLPCLVVDSGGIKNHVVSKLLIHLTGLRFELASSPL